MKLKFLGAAGEVTGSSLLVEADGVRFLIDCGMFQGGRDAAAKNRRTYGREIGRLDFVILTHAHIDHCGLLPRFAWPRHGSGLPAIYCTKPTADLVPVMLADSAFIQSRSASRPGRRRSPVTEAPLYSADDVRRLATRLNAMPYGVEFRPHPQVAVRLHNAGHIVGAASAEIRLVDGGRRRTLVASGDLGENSALLVRDRDPPPAADVLVVESTYGDRNHRSLDDTESELIEVLHEALVERRGNVVVPAFALGRAQEFVILLYRLARAERIRVPLVFIDSPLARQAAEVTFAHLDAIDEEAAEFHLAERARKLPFTLRYTESVDDSMFLNSIRSGAVIIAASGMCEAGRIRHHLRHNLPRRECAVMFTGFQAAGTLGRRIVDGARSVQLFGERVAVNASVHTLGGLSAHAGQDSLIEWLRAVPRRPRAVFINHGEPLAAHTLSSRLARELKWSAVIAEAEADYEV
ncbi:MAG: MBL fold metallo-hydrolase [Burkholderiales bacterium]|jgi:metallo-beta-lactamase family protein|nr:MBL fold metallo-hydrolase [Burkholderiales bacterium]